MLNKNGRFIVFEGIDGAGKSTHLKMLGEHLRQEGIDVVETREPGGTALGEQLRQLIIDDNGIDIRPDAELLLLFAARAQHIQERILPALKSGKWVLSDRFTAATYAYQGGGRGLAHNRIAAIEQWVQEKFQPNLVILLDITPEKSLQRAAHNSGDRFEREPLAFRTATRNAYLQLAKERPETYQVIDANGSITTTRKTLLHVLTTLGLVRDG